MKLTTYVNFAGQCAEAFRYYEQHLGAKIGMMMTHAQSPEPTPYSTGESKDAVLHARISIGGTQLAGADIPTAEPMRSAYLTLNTESDSEAERIFSALSAGRPSAHADAGDVLRFAIRASSRPFRDQLDGPA